MSDEPTPTCCGIDPTATVELPAFALAALACGRGCNPCCGARGRGDDRRTHCC